MSWGWRWIAVAALAASAGCGGDEGSSTPAGACCAASGSCYDVTRASCDVLEGAFTAGSSCSELSCQIEREACCLPQEGYCFDPEPEPLPPGHCEDQGGIYYADMDCSQIDCEATNSCCLSDGQCLGGETEFNCGAMGGVYDATTPCSQSGCGGPNSCCWPGGVCTAVGTQAECDPTVAIYSDTANCYTFDCEPATGSCCRADNPNTCASAFEEPCLAGGGTYYDLPCFMVTCP